MRRDPTNWFGLALAAFAVCWAILLGCVIAAADGDAPQDQRCGLIDYHAALDRGFDQDRWVDATPLRRHDRVELGRIFRCAAPDARPDMRTMRRKAKAEFHAHFRGMITPPGKAYLDRLGSCEADSSGGYSAVSPDGTYRGRYQFDQRTWESMGGHGDPAAAPPREQDYRAARLYRARGTSPWPRCG